VIDISRTNPPIQNQELKILDLKRRKREGWILSSSLFMPRWASRLTLEITEIRVQRLQEISEADCLAEGLTMFDADDIPLEIQYEQLWDSINGKTHPWKSNPWVWVINFKKL
jgi:hypothetical protein